jgi:hypothetical protein
VAAPSELDGPHADGSTASETTNADLVRWARRIEAANRRRPGVYTVSKDSEGERLKLLLPLAPPARPPVIHVPVRRENTARPRERRSMSASRRGPPAGDDPSEPSPAHDVDGLRGFRAASSRVFAHIGRRLAAGARA